MTTATTETLFAGGVSTLPDVIRDLTQLRDTTGKPGPRAMLTACVAYLTRYTVEETQHLQAIEAKMDATAALWQALRELLGQPEGATTEQILTAAIATIKTTMDALNAYMAD